VSLAISIACSSESAAITLRAGPKIVGPILPPATNSMAIAVHDGEFVVRCK
jgi:hypothetical protein